MGMCLYACACTHIYTYKHAQIQQRRLQMQSAVFTHPKKIGSEGYWVKLVSVADESKHVGCHACSACEGWCRSGLVSVDRAVRKTSLIHRSYAWSSLHAVSPQLLGSSLTAVACSARHLQRSGVRGCNPPMVSHSTRKSDLAVDASYTRAVLVR